MQNLNKFKQIIERLEICDKRFIDFKNKYLVNNSLKDVLFKFKINNEKYIDYVLFNAFLCVNKIFSNNIPSIVYNLIKNIKEENILMLLNGNIIYNNCLEKRCSSFVKFSELDQEYIKNYLFTSFDLTDDVAIFLNSLTFNDICVVLLPKNTKSYKLNLMNISYALNNNIGLSSRILIIVGKNSSLDLIETELGFFNKNYISNVVCEIFLDENSTLNHTKIINGDYTSLHLSNIFINQQVNSFYKLHQLSYKGCYINNNINVNLLGKRSYCEINGLDLASDVQYIKNVIRINHLVGNCKSKQLFKGIYTDKALGVFNGNIFVDAKSEGTNASQINKSILLSEDCDFMSNPNLKINADDVKCSHAATIGRFNKNELFFLRSRGLSVKEANFLLAKFFVSDVLCFKQDNKLKAIIIKKVNNWMNNNLLRI